MQKLFAQIVQLTFSHHEKPVIAFRDIAKNIHSLGLDIVNAELLVEEVFLLAKKLEQKEEAIDQLSADVEAVQIEWISNGILVRGKSSDGPFCNYYRDTSQFINQSVGGRALQFISDKAPEVGDTCILYFGMSESDTE